MRMLLASLLFAAGCSAAHADQVSVAPGAVGPRTALAIAPAKIRAPYDVQVIREGGETAPTFALKDRFYVQGAAGESYTIRVTNPTANRVEAVVSVDGLDVVDGESGDLRKRGYVVPPYGEVRIEGFRTSQADVATFRFSSVDNSYAGKKGKARNVGVIAVALFEEQASEQQQIIVNEPVDNYRQPYDYEEDLDVNVDVSVTRNRPRPADTVSKADKPAGRDWGRSAGEGKKAPTSVSSTRPAAPPPQSTPTVTGGAAGGRGQVAPSRRMLDESAADDGDSYEAPMVQKDASPRTERLGLGTEFGEQRYSAATFTKFVRNASRPIAIAELRYNDAAGLMGLGINIGPIPDAGEIMTRETADPFPGDQRFSAPPR